MFEKLKKHKPLIHRIGIDKPIQDPRFHPITTEIPVKWVGNTRNDMALLRMYTHGELKWENTGRTCGNCVNFYYDKMSKYGGRCKAYGHKQTHPDTPADDLPKGWTHPIEGIHLKPWYGCPTFQKKDRLSRR